MENPKTIATEMPVEATANVPALPLVRSDPAWLRLLDAAAWLFLSTIAMLTVRHHEPWADEAQSWLLARDLGWLKLIFSELRYEGHPGLWHSILWVAIRVFHMSYGSLGYLGATFAIAGLGVLVFVAPFPRPLRYLMASSFFLLYQYAAVARSYTMLPLIAFLAAYLFRKGTRAAIWFALALCLLTHVSVHGAVIAFAIASVYALQRWREWPELGRDQKKRLLLCAALYACSVVLLTIIVFPPREATVAAADASTFTLRTQLVKMIFGICGAFYDNLWITAFVLALLAVWCFVRGSLLALVIGVGVNALIFGFLRGVWQHEGLMLVAALVALWIVWPSDLKTEAPGFVIFHRALVGVLLVLFGVQTYWSAIAIRNDWRGAYSGAPDAAAFLKSMHAENMGCYAYNYWSVGVQPYFDHNIFPNLGGPGAPAFFHFSQQYRTNVGEFSAWHLRTQDPPCVLVSDAFSNPADADRLNNLVAYMDEQGYKILHVSQGSTFFKHRPGEQQLYLIFIRKPSH